MWHVRSSAETSLTWADIFEGSDGLFLALGEALHTKGDHLSPVGALQGRYSQTPSCTPCVTGRCYFGGFDNKQCLCLSEQ